MKKYKVCYLNKDSYLLSDHQIIESLDAAEAAHQFHSLNKCSLYKTIVVEQKGLLGYTTYWPNPDYIDLEDEKKRKLDLKEYEDNCRCAIEILDHYIETQTDWVDLKFTHRMLLENMFQRILDSDLDGWDDYSKTIYKKFLQIPGRDRYLQLTAFKHMQQGAGSAGKTSNSFPVWPAAAAMLMSTQLRQLNTSVEDIQNELSGDSSNFET